jgi:hypothetical protein
MDSMVLLEIPSSFEIWENRSLGDCADRFPTPAKNPDVSIIIYMEKQFRIVSSKK